MDLKSKAVRYLSGTVSPLLESQDNQGVFWPDQGRPVKYATEYQQHGYQVLAYLYSLEHPENPWAGNRRLQDGAVRALKNTSRIQLPSGEYQNSSHDRQPGAHAGNWRSFGTLRAMEMLKDHISSEVYSGIEQTLERALPAHERLVEGIVKNNKEHCKNHHVRNHTVWDMLATYVLARYFKKEARIAWCESELERIIACQHPAGVWFEHGGLVNVYQHLTMAGISHYHALTGSEPARAALRRCLEHFKKLYYPSGHPVETIDGRVRYTNFTMSLLPATWAEIPEGRSTLNFLLDKLNMEGLGQGYHTHGGWFGLIYIAQFVRDLPEAAHTIDREQFEPIVGDGLHTLPELPVAVLREGPWTVVLSGLTKGDRSARWSLDYQAHCSIYHKNKGLIFGGGGGKRQAQLSLFTGGTARPLGLPCLATYGRIEALGEGGRGCRLQLKYPEFDAELDVVIEDGSVRLKATVQPGENGRVGQIAHLQLPFLIKGDAPVTGEHGAIGELWWQQDMSPAQIGSRLGRPGLFNLAGLENARALILLNPYNSHWGDGWYHPEKNLGIVAQPLKPNEPRALVLTADE